MRNLPQKIVLALLLVVSAFAQSPHGDDFDYDCELCHEPTSWRIDIKKVKFDHSITKFELVGQHKATDCRSCHSSLQFSKINSDCISCHTDLHQGTVGKDCSKCHTSKSWMVEDINGLHQKGRFPLVGNHMTADCQSCHNRYLDLYFEPLNTDCYACHSDNYNSTQNPNHASAGFSTECQDCHDLTATSWSTVNVVHDFFPLVGGHAISDCFACHTPGGNFAGLSPVCYACHEDDYNNPSNDPNHVAANFSTNCQECHTINGWSPSSFNHNLTEFPLTGSHISTECSSCHATGFDGTPTLCFACHEADFNAAADPNHVTSNFPHECEVCHNTTAWEPAEFNHDLTSFPLTGKHITTNCQECHSTGYTGTPTDCYACHQQDYELVQDPNHVLKGYSTDCTQCHTTNGWEDLVNFNHNTTQFPLTGAHITTDCNSCHAQGYTNTPTDCYLCHTEDYNNSTNPNHIAAGFPTTCMDCHTTTAWVPSTFDHDGQYFPIYTGKHAGEWTLCADCHQVPNNFAVFTCISCHEHNQIEMDDKHQNVQGYIYESGACLSCHPDGTKANAFNHSASNFPLTGAHLAISCQDCHSGGYQGTPTECLACHQTNYNNSANPSHTALQLPTDCASCHTTNPDWTPATFPIHNQFFELLGAHLNITNCDDCHNGNFTNTPNTCIGCHQTDFNATTDPPHQILNFSVDCLECHTMNAWSPANFNHSFYIISSQHNEVNCVECHSEPNYQSQCLSCHLEDFNNGHNPGDPTDCWTCHSTSNWDSNFDHNNTNFPLTGAHLAISCQDCHSGGYQGTPTECIACHQTNYNSTTNPDHEALMLPTTCESCHTTNANWQPAIFPIHNQYFELLGAHLNITNCDDCHNGNFNNTPNTCIACHQNEFNGTTDPPHQILNFSFDCLICHTMNGWTPANFNHSFFPVSSHHNNVDCNQCHSEPNYQPQCLSCHLDDFLEEHNQGDPTDCWNCHDASNWSINLKIKEFTPKD